MTAAPVTETERVVRQLHWLLAKLHEALAFNQVPDADVADIAERLSAWWRSREAGTNGAAPAPAVDPNDLDLNLTPCAGCACPEACVANDDCARR